MTTFFCYPSEQWEPGGPIKVDPTRAYLRHYDNYLYLSFLASRSDRQAERAQARKEIEICERKMKFHYRSADKQALLKGIQELKGKWR